MTIRSFVWVAAMGLILWLASVFVHSTEHPNWHPTNCTITAPDNPQPLTITCHP